MPIILRPMTPGEVLEYPGCRGLYDKDTKAVSWSPKCPGDAKLFGHVLGHELGHHKFPVEMDLKTDFPERFNVQDLFRELVANYYSLSLNPRDSLSRSGIRDKKMEARGQGLTRSQVDRVDKVAREKVGYTGKSITYHGGQYWDGQHYNYHGWEPPWMKEGW